MAVTIQAPVRGELRIDGGLGGLGERLGPVHVCVVREGSRGVFLAARANVGPCEQGIAQTVESGTDEIEPQRLADGDTDYCPLNRRSRRCIR